MTGKRTWIFVVLILIIVTALISFSCGLLLVPAISVLAPTPTLTFTITPTPTFTPSPLPPIYVTLNVNEFATYTVYWKRDLWESAVRGDISFEDFENDTSDYGEMNFPYLTGNGFLLNGDSSSQILSDGSLMSSGNLIHFRDWGNGMRFSYPNNAVVGAFGFDYQTSEDWQLAFNDYAITLPGGRNRFIGVVVHDFFPADFVLSSFERVQGGLSVDNISYMPIANATAVPSPTGGSVTIVAAGGDINIRRGPGADYNPVGLLLDQQSSMAIARNENGTWLYITIPGTSDELGWINAITRLTRVTGDVNFLPVMTVEPAAPAYVRNCTPNPMLLRPGEIKVNGYGFSPDNVVPVFPGDYEVYDTLIPNDSIVGTILVREGNTVDITEDGLKKKYSCP